MEADDLCPNADKVLLCVDEINTDQHPFFNRVLNIVGTRLDLPFVYSIASIVVLDNDICKHSEQIWTPLKGILRKFRSILSRFVLMDCHPAHLKSVSANLQIRGSENMSSQLFPEPVHAVAHVFHIFANPLKAYFYFKMGDVLFNFQLDGDFFKTDQTWARIRRSFTTDISVLET